MIQFDYLGPTGRPDTVTWLILDRGEASVCNTHPGYDVDLVVTTDALAFTRVLSGNDTLAEAMAKGSVRIDGPPRLVRAFPRWFLWSPLVQAVRARTIALTAD